MGERFKVKSPPFEPCGEVNGLLEKSYGGKKSLFLGWVLYINIFFDQMIYFFMMVMKDVYGSFFQALLNGDAANGVIKPRCHL